MTTEVRRRDPFEIVFAFVLALSSTLQLLMGAAPGSLTLLLPRWAQIAWLSVAVLGCIAILAGVYWREPITGVFVEAYGLMIVSMVLVTYGIGIFIVTGLAGRGMTSGVLTVLLGMAFGWKWIQLRHVIRRLPR